MSLSSETYRDVFRQRIKEYSKKHHEKGFRKGDTSIVKLRYGKRLLEEVVHAQAAEALTKYVREKGLRLIGRPYFQEEESILPASEGDGASLIYELDLVPPFSLKLDTTIEATEYEVSPLADEELEEGLTVLRDVYRTYKTAERSGPGTTLYGNLKREDKGEEVAIQVAISSKVKSSEASLLNGSLGDVVPFSGDLLQGQLGSLPVVFREAVEQELPLSFEIERIEEHVPAVLDQAFFDKVVGSGKATDLSSFKVALGPVLEAMSREAADRLTKESVIKAVVAVTDVPLGRRYEERREAATWSLIVDRVSQEEGLEVGAQEVLEAAKKTFRSLFLKEHHRMPEEQELTSYVIQFLQKDQGAHYAELSKHLLEEKVYKIVAGRIGLKKKLVCYRELRERHLV